MSAALPPLSLYIHLPWCVRKCPYCDFNSHQADRFHEAGELPEDAYLKQLLADLDCDLPYVQGRAIQTAFIGGGTPSLMSADFYYRLMDALREKLTWVDNAEITMEANPGTFEQEKFRHFRQAGINRLSIGTQSYQANLLKTLGRIHNPAEAIGAVEKSRLAGFDNINIDLMHGLPGQSLAVALADLQQAIDLAPEHLSWYQLTIEPNTEFYRRPPTLPEDNTLWDIQDEGLALLEANGYHQYEISANAKVGYQAQHNLNYWRFGDYLGIGAGAHGKVTLGDGAILRTRKTRHPNHYLHAIPASLTTNEAIAAEDLPLEFMMNRLRLFEAFPLQEYLRYAEAQYAPVLLAGCAQALAQGWLEADAWQQQIVQTTPKGKLFLNELLELFLPEN
jgi:oxygen-independent coproporphyrinogen-3 oxidase